MAAFDLLNVEVFDQGIQQFEKYNHTEMPKESQRRKYKTIKYQQRIKIIQKVCRENISYIEVAKEMNLCPSTVKMIAKKFSQTGQIFEKKEEKERRCFEEALREQFQKKKSEPQPENTMHQISFPYMPCYYQTPIQYCINPMNQPYQFSGYYYTS